MELISDNNSDMDISEKQSYDRLIDGKDIRFKTEINNDQRCIISCIETSIDNFNKKEINLYVAKRFVLSFIDMGASLDRKSRKEIVDALKSKIESIDRQQLIEKQQQQLR